MLLKKVIDNTNEKRKEIFNYPLEENQDSDNLIMIVSSLIKDYDDENSVGYALMFEKRPSLTPLKANMTFRELDDW